MSLVKRERKVPIQDLGAKLRVLADEFLFKNYFNILGRLELLGPVLADFAESPEVAELLVAPVEVANNPTAESVNLEMRDALKLLVKDNIHRAKLIGTEVNWAAIHQAQAAISNAEAQLGPPRVAADQKLTDLNSDGIKITCMGELCGEPVATNLRESGWISVKEKLPEFEEPVWGLLRMQDSTGYCLAIVMRGDGDDGWLWHICDDWGGRMIAWPYRLEDSAQFECDDDYRVKLWMPLSALPKPPEPVCNAIVATNSVTGEEDTCSLKLGHFPETPHELDLSSKSEKGGAN